MCLGLQVGWGAGRQPKRQPAQKKGRSRLSKNHLLFVGRKTKRCWPKFDFRIQTDGLMSSQFKVCFSPKRTKDSVCVERVFNRREPSAEPTRWRPLSWMTAQFEREKKSMCYFFPTRQNKSVLVCSVWVLLCEAWRRDRGRTGRTGLYKATPTLLSWLRHQREV